VTSIRAPVTAPSLSGCFTFPSIADESVAFHFDPGWHGGENGYGLFGQVALLYTVSGGKGGRPASELTVER
jgi:hypothetical protein